MRSLRLLYRDYDRAPYLYMLRDAAARRGLTVELNKAELGPRYPEFLLEGAADILAENYWGLQSLAAAGTPAVSLATAVCRLNEQLFVHPGIAALDDLRGKRFALRGVGPSELIARLWLHDRGLTEVEPVVIPESEVGRWGQWKAVESGDCHGVFVTNFHCDAPLRAGLKPWPLSPYGFIGNVTLTGLQPLVDERPDDIADLVASAFEATRLFRDDEAATMAVLRREPRELLGVDDEGLRALYRVLREELSPEPVPTAEAISNTYRMRLGRSPELAGFNPLLAWDLSFARRARREREADHRR